MSALESGLSAKLSNMYGEYCFNDRTMRERLPSSIYSDMKEIQNGGRFLTPEIAEVVANAMKDWAIEKGATHYTHWFQPLTGLTAEKHDSFISPTQDGRVLMEFSGKELIKGEPDASSFPSGGLRATFEARGYTAWDTSSPAFIQDLNGITTLTIPTAFISYRGEALDKKTPLLRSMDALDKAAIRVLRALGNTATKRVTPTVGPEQEYFLVDKELAARRPDLRITGRTVFGSMSAKGQEMEDHYFGAIKERVLKFMHELNCELWRLGISAKTQHNEVAPNQFELATIFDTANLSTDRNQVVMKMIKNVADRHGMLALLHEKPFAGVNGSGKHCNWSLCTDDGYNLLKPGDNPYENAQFLFFFTAVIEAVDTCASLLRLSAANPGNDHRLGANEAPPAIISIFLGDQLSSILDDLTNGTSHSKRSETMEIGVNILPNFPRDLTDRNRTSPFAFTGDKFEFRMVGSSQSLAGPNVILNSSVAMVLNKAADRLEKTSNPMEEVKRIIIESYRNHRRIIFNGNGYSEEWIKEAEKRGLPNLSSTVEALPELLRDEHVAMLENLRVFSRAELASRKEIYLESYSKQINIEAGIMVEMARRQIAPAVTRYMTAVAEAVMHQESLKLSTARQRDLLTQLSEHLENLYEAADKVKHEADNALALENILEQAKAYRYKVVPAMDTLRYNGDVLEKLTDRSIWPYPSYEDLLFTL